MQKPLLPLAGLFVAVGFAVGFAGKAGAQAVVAASGGPLLHIDTRSKTSGVTITSDGFTNLPDAQVKIAIPPAGGSRLVVANFSAESNCSGSTVGADACHVRIVALNTGTNAVTELNPKPGSAFSFDSVAAPTGVSGSRAIQRSIRLNPGNYTVRVQGGVANAGLSFHLAGWHLTVEQYD